MRQTNRRAALAVVFVCVATLLAVSTCPAMARERPYRWRSSRYGRKGAEIWAEVPRYSFPVGKGYKDEYDLHGGPGFGFGVMFAFSDKFALEARMLQTIHDTVVDDVRWDIDQALVGFRYGFRYERAFQPFVAAGGARLSLEYDPIENQTTEFRRLSGYGAYGSLGIDYVVSNRWVVGFRTDYVWMRYSESLLGTQSDTIDDAIKGDIVALSLSVHYRVPVFW